MDPKRKEFDFLIDEKSFTWLFTNYWERVYSICFSNIRSHEDAREFTQNIFKSLWERRKEIGITGNPEHYLLRAAKLQVINYYRDTKIQEGHQTRLKADYRDFDNSTENEILFNQLNDQLGILVDQLPDQCKLVYQLSRNQNLSNKQVAAMLSISLKTVEYHLTNANRLLKSSLQEYI